MIRLRVWANELPMGWFGHQAGQYFFQYDEDWLKSAHAYVLAPQFVLRTEPHLGEPIKTFFANLLPEGAALEEILSAIHMRDASTFEIIGQLGGELPGVLSVRAEGNVPSGQQQYSALSKNELSQRIKDRDQQKPLLTSNEQSSMSLPGAQDKLGLRYDAKRDRLYDSVGSTPTTHIVKPDTRLVKFQPSAINEYLCMRLAAAIKLPVPPVHLIQVPETVYIVQRYDRILSGDSVKCLHQMDGCQLLGLGQDWKYERQGLVSLKRIVEALRGLQLPAKDLLSFQRWVMFNYLIGNSDAHAKNISVLMGETGYALAPFYDLLCVRVYGDDRLALYVGDEDQYASIGAHSWEAFCGDCGFSVKPTLSLFRKMAQDVTKAWAIVTAQVTADYVLSQQELALIQSITEVIETHCSAAMSMTEKR
jgi:serine/threonine-protein kinase HipA